MVQQNVLSNTFLQQWIDEKGRVDYESLKSDENLRKLWESIEQADLSALSHEEEFAFWLNAYNLLAIKGVLEELEQNPH